MGSLAFRLKFFMAVLLAVMLMGTLGFSYLQNLSLLDAFYFTIVTIATVGYGDIVPTTQAGRVLAVILIITGVGAFLGVVVNAAETFILKRKESKGWRSSAWSWASSSANSGLTCLRGLPGMIRTSTH
jgi:voltage-gated potassium channel Kch